jgi:hypothetical protein
MPDERLDSMRQGIGAPPESAQARRADRERRDEIVNDPSPVQMEGAMGGTSDADRAGDEADADAAFGRGTAGDRTAPDGGGADERDPRG